MGTAANHRRLQHPYIYDPTASSAANKKDQLLRSTRQIDAFDRRGHAFTIMTILDVLPSFSMY
jgi:hypothetical protein